MKYTKKPVTIDALEWTGINHRPMFEFLGGGRDEAVFTSNHNFYIEHRKVVGGLVIKTLEGEHIANVGDFIIKGIEGEFYPCKPSVFHKTYIKG